MEMNAVSIIHHPHPVLPAVGQSCAVHTWTAGETVREMLIKHGVDVNQEIVILCNDRLLTVAEWDTVCPQPHDIINIKAVVSGGGDDGGSNVLQVVLMIVVIAVAWEFAPALSGAFGGSTAAGSLGVSIAQGAIMVAGNALIGAIFAPSGRALSSANGLENSGKDTPNYSLSGGSNSIRPYQPLPVVMGTHRIFPDYGAKPFTEFQGDDQYLYQIFNFGLSALSVSDFKIGETPLANYADVSTYWGDATGRIPGFAGNVDSDQGGQLIRDAAWLQRTTSPDTTQIALDIEGSIYYQGDRGLLSCAATVEAYYAPAGSGAWVPMASRTVVTYTTGYWSLQTTEIVYDQEGNGSAQQVQQDFANTGHYEGETQLVRASFYTGFYTEPAVYGTWTWVTFAYADELISSWNNQQRFAHPDPLPIYSTTYDLEIAHGTSQKVQRNTIRANVPLGQYDVRVRLTSARSSNGEIADDDSRGGYQYGLSAIRSYQEDAATYTGQNRLGMVIRASGQLNGVVQQFSAMASAYCHVWDGSAWRWQPTSNPAWWFLDFALGRLNSDGEKLYGCHLGWAAIDVDAIKAWANFCNDEALTCNLVLDRAQSSWETLGTIARCGMASLSYASGTLGIIWDRKNASPVAAFGMSNIIKGSFSVQYVTENLADEIVVSFVDSNRDWQQDQVRALSPGVTNPIRTSTVEMMGCTNATMAGKFANYLAAQQVYRKRMISWESDFEGFTCQRGDVVILSHDLTQWGYSGRLVEVAGSVLTLERKVPRSGAVEYLMVAFPDGTLTTYSVTAGSGDQDVITLTAPLTLQSGYTAIDHRWFFSPLSTPGKKVKIVSVRPVSQSRVAIVATDETPEFYDAWNGVWSQPAQNTLLKNTLPVIKSLAISESLFAVNNGGINNRITVSANISDSFDAIYWKWRFKNGAWNTQTTYGAALTFDSSEVGQLEVSASALSNLFFGAACKEVQQILGITAPPSDVQNFQGRITGSNIWLTYTPTTEIDVIIGGAIKIRHASALSGATWEAAADLFQGAAPASGVSVPAMVGTYLAKFVDGTGNESANAVSLVNEISLSLIAMNVIATINDAPIWAGTHSSTRYDAPSTSIILDALVLVDSAGSFDAITDFDRYGGMSLSGDYTLTNTIDIGQADTCRISGSITFVCADSGVNVDSLADFDTFPDMDGVVPSGATAKIQVALSQDGATFGPWVDLFAGEAKFRKIKARLVLSSTMPNVNVRVSAATITVDMPDRVEDGRDIVSGAAAYVVTYSRPFQTAPAVAITAQNMATGDYYTITAKTTAGFTITFKNSAGAAISRTFDHVSKGY